MSNNMSFRVALSFEKAKLPPFSDILILGRKSPIGMSGISKSMEFLLPNNFDIFEINDEIVEAIVVNKVILKRMPFEKIHRILMEKVIPFMSDTEMIRVDFSVEIIFEKFNPEE
ncbi:MAG TPA: hypothetical protein PKY31_10390 [Spirochaetota bacterium]|nr:hypothetical protein [Spirochaetota bacterium]